MILPYPPGGAGDIVGSLVGAKLNQIFGQSMVIDNKGGGAQMIATEALRPPRRTVDSAAHGEHHKSFRSNIQGRTTGRGNAHIAHVAGSQPCTLSSVAASFRSTSTHS